MQVTPFSLWVERMNSRCSGFASWQVMQRLVICSGFTPLKVEDLGLIAASLQRAPRRVHGTIRSRGPLATNLLGVSYSGMRAGLNALACVVMAAFAGVRPNVLRRIRGLSGLLVCG